MNKRQWSWPSHLTGLRSPISSRGKPGFSTGAGRSAMSAAGVRIHSSDSVSLIRQGLTCFSVLGQDRHSAAMSVVPRRERHAGKRQGPGRLAVGFGFGRVLLASLGGFLQEPSNLYEKTREILLQSTTLNVNSGVKESRSPGILKKQKGQSHAQTVFIASDRGGTGDFGCPMAVWAEHCQRGPRDASGRSTDEHDHDAQDTPGHDGKGSDRSQR